MLALWFISSASVLALWVWSFVPVYRKFGLEGIALKVALSINGIFIARLALYFNEDAWGMVMIFGVVWAYLLFASWPMRWLMKPPANWLIYGICGLYFFVMFAAEKGWISHGPL